jgi:CheY-like chemotaxis protein
MGMATNPTLLCIHRDPARLRVLQENGYELLTAANGHEGLQLFRSRPVDAIVLEYNLGLLDGSVIASEIKQIRPNVPIVMVAEHAELPAGALQSVDVLVSTSDPPHFLWAAVHFLLTVKPARHRELRASAHVRRLGRSREGLGRTSGDTFQSVTEERDVPFSVSAWKSILNGTIQF